MRKYLHAVYERATITRMANFSLHIQVALLLHHCEKNFQLPCIKRAQYTVFQLLHIRYLQLQDLKMNQKSVNTEMHMHEGSRNTKLVKRHVKMQNIVL